MAWRYSKADEVAQEYISHLWGASLIFYSVKVEINNGFLYIFRVGACGGLRWINGVSKYDFLKCRVFPLG